MASPTTFQLSLKASSISQSQFLCKTPSIAFNLRINRRKSRCTLCSKTEDRSSRRESAAGKEVKGLIFIDLSSERHGLDKDFDESGVGVGKVETERRNLKSANQKWSTWRRILFASKRVRSIILLNVITMIYASDIPVLKEVEATVDPALFTCVRFILSATPFIPFVIQARGDAKTRNAGIELGVWISLGYFAQSIGLLTSDAGRASFISMFTVIVVAVFDGILGVTIPAHTFFGALMSITGVVLLESSGSPPTIGDLFNLLSAVFFGIHMYRTQHISRCTNKEDFLPLLGYEICIVACFSVAWYLLSGTVGQSAIPCSWNELSNLMVGFPWIPALYTGVLSTGLCLWIEMSAMCDISATETAIVYGMEPIWGAGFAWFLLGERWGTMGWIGAALVLCGSLTVQIFGSLSPTSDTQLESSKNKILLPSDSPKNLIASPIVISSPKRTTEPFKDK